MCLTCVMQECFVYVRVCVCACVYLIDAQTPVLRKIIELISSLHIYIYTPVIVKMLRGLVRTFISSAYTEYSEQQILQSGTTHCSGHPEMLNKLIIPTCVRHIRTLTRNLKLATIMSHTFAPLYHSKVCNHTQPHICTFTPFQSLQPHSAARSSDRNTLVKSQTSDDLLLQPDTQIGHTSDSTTQLTTQARLHSSDHDMLIKPQASEAAATPGHTSRTHVFSTTQPSTQAHPHSSDHDMLIKLQASEAVAAPGHTNRTHILTTQPSTQAHLHSSDHDMLIKLQASEAAAAPGHTNRTHVFLNYPTNHTSTPALQ